MSKNDRKFFESYLAGEKQDSRTSHTQTHADRIERMSEDSFVEAYDAADLLVEYAKEIDDMRKGKIEVSEFLQTVSPQAILTILQAMTQSSKESVRVDAAKDLLDRAGHGKINKVAMGTKNFSRSDPKEELLAHIMGFSATSDVIKVIDDEKEEKED